MYIGGLTKFLTRHRSIITLVAVLAIGWGAVRYYLAMGRTVNVQPVKRVELVQTVVATGRIATLSRVELGALVGGVVEEVKVKEGDRVKAGETLLTLRATEAKADVALAQAEVQRALATLQTSRASSEQARSGVARAQSLLSRLSTVDRPAAEKRVQVALDEEDAARRRLARAEKLFEREYVSVADLDEALKEVSVAQKRREEAQLLAASFQPGGGAIKEAEAALAQAKAATDLGTAGELEAQAAVAQTRAAVAAIQARLENYLVLAPREGVVIQRQVEAGDAVGPGRSLLTLSIPGYTEIVCAVDEKNLPLLKIGQKAQIAADAYPGRPFGATLSTIVPAVTASTGTVTVKFTVPEPPAFLLPEMTVSIEVETARKKDALTVGLEAVRELHSTPWAYVAENGRAVRRDLKTGLRSETRIELLSGVKEGDFLIDGSDSAVKAGDTLRATVVR